MNKIASLSSKKSKSRPKNPKFGSAASARTPQRSSHENLSNGRLLPAGRRSDFLVFGAPQIQNAEIEAVLEFMGTRWLGNDPRVLRFQEEFLDYKGDGWRLIDNCGTVSAYVCILAASIFYQRAVVDVRWEIPISISA